MTQEQSSQAAKILTKYS